MTKKLLNGLDVHSVDDQTRSEGVLQIVKSEIIDFGVFHPSATAPLEIIPSPSGRRGRKHELPSTWSRQDVSGGPKNRSV
jgi:hypothetical protein